ncbi:MAG: hypothetical protein KDD52_02185 [Bdellovibrionales bacterium]|nr:hypothetical protein [Bdellovibrionales bacterium]
MAGIICSISFLLFSSFDVSNIGQNPLREYLNVLKKNILFCSLFLIPGAILMLQGKLLVPSYSLFWMMYHPVVSTIFSTSLAFFSHSKCRKKFHTMALSWGIVAFFSAITLYDLYTKPNFFFLHPMIGYFPGPIYDEWIPLFPKIFTYRVWLLVLSAAFVLYPVQKHRKLSLGIFTLSLFLLCFRSSLLWAPSYTTLRSTLGGLQKGQHHFLYYSPEHLDNSQANRLQENLDFYIHHLRKKLEINLHEKISVYLYPDSITKKKLTGTQWTLFGHPIQNSVHLLPSDVWDSLLIHELSHVISSPYGIPILHTGKSLALTESLSSALQDSQEEISIHQKAACIYELQKLPSIENIDSSIDFLNHNSFLSYTAYGSFALWLIDNYSIKKFLYFYQGKSFFDSFGIEILEAEEKWKSFIHSIDIDSNLLEKYRERIFSPSLFQKKYPHIQAHLMHQWNQAAQRKDEGKVQTLGKKILSIDTTPSIYFVRRWLLFYPTIASSWIETWTQNNIQKLSPSNDRIALQIALKEHHILQGDIHNNPFLSEGPIEEKLRWKIWERSTPQERIDFIQGRFPSTQILSTLNSSELHSLVDWRSDHITKIANRKTLEELFAWSLESAELSQTSKCRIILSISRAFEALDRNRSIEAYKKTRANCPDSLQDYLKFQVERLQSLGVTKQKSEV